MDVILDSNAYISDIRMESIRFKNLFDYLRRTKSFLVLPRLVREEMIAKYRKLLDEQAQKTGKAIKELNRLIFKKTSQIQYTAPKSAYVARDVRRKFRELQKIGALRYYPETFNIDVGEVFLRGVRRRAPANAAGEELRDVIVWLIALQYAEAENKPIAFVSADGGFWKEAGVHEHLTEDMSQRKVNISLFRSIEDFIKDSAPQSSPADEAYVLKVFDVATVGNQITNAVKKQLYNSKRLLSQSFTIESIESISLRFSGGTIYEIDPDTKFMELAYDSVFTAYIGFVQQGLPATSWIGGLRGPFGGLEQSFSLAAPISVFDQQREFILALNSGRAVLQTTPASRAVEGYAVSAVAHISIRLVKQIVTENELDRVEIKKVEEIVMQPRK